MTIGCIIPDRGDRPEFLEQCRKQMELQTRVPDVVSVIDFPPVSTDYDLTKRIRMGYDNLTKMGIDVAVIIENDDLYSCDYIELIESLFTDGVDMIGFNNTTYYHLGLKMYKRLPLHNTHSSLFQTAIRTGIDIHWPRDNHVLLDTELWRDKGIKRSLFQIETNCVGIKHGIGKTGGRAHGKDFNYNVPDPGMRYLKLMAGDQFGFYMGLVV